MKPFSLVAGRAFLGYEGFLGTYFSFFQIIYLMVNELRGAWPAWSAKLGLKYRWEIIGFGGE